MTFSWRPRWGGCWNSRHECFTKKMEKCVGLFPKKEGKSGAVRWHLSFLPWCNLKVDDIMSIRSVFFWGRCAFKFRCWDHHPSHFVFVEGQLEGCSCLKLLFLKKNIHEGKLQHVWLAGSSQGYSGIVKSFARFQEAFLPSLLTLWKSISARNRSLQLAVFERPWLLLRKRGDEFLACWIWDWVVSWQNGMGISYVTNQWGQKGLTHISYIWYIYIYVYIISKRKSHRNRSSPLFGKSPGGIAVSRTWLFARGQVVCWGDVVILGPEDGGPGYLCYLVCQLVVESLRPSLYWVGNPQNL